MRNILSQSLINELDELDQLTSSVLHGNLHYDGVLEQLNMTKREKILKQHGVLIYLLLRNMVIASQSEERTKKM